MTPRNHSASRHTQHGAVLIIALIMLLLLTLLGVNAMRGTTMEERMAGNLRDQSIAFQAAEAALRAGENAVGPLVTRPVPCSALGTCVTYTEGVLPDLSTQDHAWWLANGTEYGTAGTNDINGVATDPRYVIEERGYDRDDLVTGFGLPTGRDIYRVTARGTGQTNDAEARVQATYAKRFN